FYGASGSGKCNSRVCFLLLAREVRDVYTGCKSEENTPMVGLEVWPLGERAKPDVLGRVGDSYRDPAAASVPESHRRDKREAYQGLMPGMLNQMLINQAPVIQSLPHFPSGPARGANDPRDIDGRAAVPSAKPSLDAQGVVALLPLTIGDRIAGALWIVRYGSTTAVDKPTALLQSNPTTAATPAATGLVADSAALHRGDSGILVNAAAAAVRGNIVAQPAPCPHLLTSPQALQQLGLSASLCLLGPERDFTASLCESLRQLSSASSMQQLVSALCDALGCRMREHFLLEPRVFAALVPEATSTVGLMFGTRPSAATPAISRSTAKISRLASSGGMDVVNSTDGRRDTMRPLSPRVAMINGKDSFSLSGRPASDNIPSNLPQNGGGGGNGSSPERDGGTPLRALRTQGVLRVMPLTQADLALVDATLSGVGANSAPSVPVASGSFMALCVKPFPLAQTLLRHAVRKVVNATAAAAQAASGYSSSDSAAGSGGRERRFRAYGAEVADCALHVQDPKKPSRDVLLLIANGGAIAAPSSITPNGAAGITSLCVNASGGSTSGRRTVSSLLLLVLPFSDGKAMLGLYVTFPQTLPQQLLRQARSTLLEVLEVCYPILERKLSTDLAVELETLVTAAPGSYAVLEAPEADACTPTSATVAANVIECSTGCNTLRASGSKLILQQSGDAEPQPERVVPIYSQLVQSFLYDSRGGGGIGGPGSSTLPGGGGGGGGALAATRSLNLMDTHSDLSQLELHSQLGHGGCAVVFKGTLGTLDCAIKVDGTDTASGRDVMTLKWSGGDGGNGDGKVGSRGEADDGSTSLAARRALLRNAMELAAMTSISHPNVMQVYSTFSNVTLGRRLAPDGSDRFYLKPVDGTMSTLPDAPPICVAIVCEWCDKGCLGSALQKRSFPTLLPQNSKKLGSQQASGNSASSNVIGGSKAARYDFKGILMTLLDVAMALRHLHAHNIIHRDVKPANVLLKSNVMDPRGFTAKLADFGFVTLLNQPGDEKSGGEPFAWVDETCGTVTHMAPECWQKPHRLDASCDVYREMTSGGSRPYPEVRALRELSSTPPTATAAGTWSFVWMLSGVQPSNIAQVVKRGARPVFDEGVPVSYRFLAQRCWTTEPASRPRTSELVTSISQMLSKM
ncbi:hypothetical protein VOLCADRAFT_118406, partial [Volvox carteri f. nagariensis]